VLLAPTSIATSHVPSLLISPENALHPLRHPPHPRPDAHIASGARQNGPVADAATNDVLQKWTYILETLQTDPMLLSRELDWVIKREWIQSYMDKNRLSWRDPKISLMDLQYHDIRPDRGIQYRPPARPLGRTSRPAEARVDWTPGVSRGRAWPLSAGPSAGEGALRANGGPRSAHPWSHHF